MKISNLDMRHVKERNMKYAWEAALAPVIVCKAPTELNSISERFLTRVKRFGQQKLGMLEHWYF